MSGNKRSLLLLPFSLKTPSRHAIASLYKQPLSAALSQSRNSQRPATLSIAVVGNFLLPPPTGDSSALRVSWSHAQSVLAAVYSLVAYLCAQQSIPTETNAGPNSVDARVVLIQDDRFGASAGTVPNGTLIQALSEFRRKEGSWASIFHTKSQEGMQLATYYADRRKDGHPAIDNLLVGLESGTATVQEGGSRALSPSKAVSSRSQYQVVCLGGTFDHLHPGHKLLLSAAALLLKAPSPPEPPSRFIIGVTGDEMLKNKKYAEFVQSWEVRARGVLDFLGAFIDGAEGEGAYSSSKDGELIGTFRGGRVVVECVIFQDLYGPTISVEAIEALVVSGETRSGGKAVNDKRVEQGWKELDVYEVDVLDARDISGSASGVEDFGSKISSTAIRQQKATFGSGAGRL
jgi:phosphopantetheine adenylyltransferase